MKIFNFLRATLLIASLSMGAYNQAYAAEPDQAVQNGDFAWKTDRQIWLAPQGLMPAPLTSNVDFMEMFVPDAPWKEAASHTQVFSLYGAFLGHATQDQVNTVVADLNRRGIAIAVEVGVINVLNKPTPPCGGLGIVEGYGTVALAQRISQMIKNAGGEIKYIAMDEPFYYGHYYTKAPNRGYGCHSFVSEIIKLSAPTLNEFIKEFPRVIIGDIEPTVVVEQSPAWKDDLLEWVVGLRAVIGRPLAFMQLDIEWKQANGVEDALAFYHDAEALRAQDLLRKTGIIYDGLPPPTADAAWVEDAQDHVLLMEGKYKLRPDQAIFQSWMPNPTHAMPDSAHDTLTSLVVFYFSPMVEAITGRGYTR